MDSPWWARAAEHVLCVGLVAYVAWPRVRARASRIAGRAADAAVEAPARQAAREMTGVGVRGGPLETEGRGEEELGEELERAADGDGPRPSEGFAFAYVYTPPDEACERVSKRAFDAFAKLNALNPSAFPSLRKFEVEIVEMCKSMVHAPETACGMVTSGGSESIFLALKAARDFADRGRGETWECVMPTTAHPAFAKAAHALRVDVVYVPVDDVSQTVDPRAVERAVTSRTCLLVVSAPSYPSGILDPIEAVARIGFERDVPVHVDACVGGFLLPFWNANTPAWDFACPGVTSLSMDPHKFGYTAKGASVLLYRDYEMRRMQYFALTSWPGGLFVSPGVLGTRPGGPLASCWATMKFMGRRGYERAVRECMETTSFFLRTIENELGEDLRVVGNPVVNVFAIRSRYPSKLNVFAVADCMESLGPWKLERNINPDSIHLTVMPPHARTKNRFADDLRRAVAAVKRDPGSFAGKGSVAMYGSVKRLPGTVTESFLVAWMDHVFRPVER